MIRSLLLSVLFFGVGTAVAQSTSGVDSLFTVAQTAYENGQYEPAEMAALRGLRRTADLEDLDRLRFHLLLGFIYTNRDQREAAREEFTKVLITNPDYKLDPFEASPTHREIFAEARPKADSILVTLRWSADRRIAASMRSLVLPGWGQFYKKQNTKGTAIVVAQVLSLAALLVMQAEVNRRHDDYLRLRRYGDPDFDDRYAEYRRAWQTRNTVGYVTLGLYLFNYFDALYSPGHKYPRRAVVKLGGR